MSWSLEMFLGIKEFKRALFLIWIFWFYTGPPQPVSGGEEEDVPCALRSWDLHTLLKTSPRRNRSSSRSSDRHIQPNSNPDLEQKRFWAL